MARSIFLIAVGIWDSRPSATLADIATRIVGYSRTPWSVEGYAVRGMPLQGDRLSVDGPVSDYLGDAWAGGLPLNLTQHRRIPGVTDMRRSRGRATEDVIHGPGPRIRFHVVCRAAGSKKRFTFDPRADAAATRFEKPAREIPTLKADRLVEPARKNGFCRSRNFWPAFDRRPRSRFAILRAFPRRGATIAPRYQTQPSHSSPVARRDLEAEVFDPGGRRRIPWRFRGARYVPACYVGGAR